MSFPSMREDLLGERDTKKLETFLTSQKPEERLAKSAKILPLDTHKTVWLNHPKPVALNKLIEDAASWSGYSFVMDPSLNREIQIFAPRRLPQDEALGLLIAALENAGLRMIELEGMIIKIVEPPH